MSQIVQFEQVQQVLLNVWDPIGVGGVEGCEDEYNSYAKDILTLLQNTAPREEIQDYLIEIETDFMGLTPKLQILEQTLDHLFALTA